MGASADEFLQNREACQWALKTSQSEALQNQPL